jgi:hypothetical protein
LRRWLKTAIESIEVLFDNFQRKILIALCEKYVAKTI